MVETPEAGKRAVESRGVVRCDVLDDDDDDDPGAFLVALGYEFVKEYARQGYQFVSSSVLISLFQLLAPPPTSTTSTTTMQILDATWILEASVIVSSDDHAAMTAATEQLKALRAELRGVCDLEVVDRMALDSRVR